MRQLERAQTLLVVVMSMGANEIVTHDRGVYDLEEARAGMKRVTPLALRWHDACHRITSSQLHRFNLNLSLKVASLGWRRRVRADIQIRLAVGCEDDRLIVAS